MFWFILLGVLFIISNVLFYVAGGTRASMVFCDKSTAGELVIDEEEGMPYLNMNVPSEVLEQDSFVILRVIRVSREKK